MVTLRLFANLRETAGTSAVDIEGATVGDILDEAAARYGPAFAAALETAQIWLNGDQAERRTLVTVGDEIAAIPPVSGGAVAPTGVDLVSPALVVGLLVGLIVANVTSREAVVVASVGLAAVWLWDLGDVYQLRGRFVRMIPAVLAVAAAGNGAYRWGTSGLAGGMAVGIGILLTWSVLDERQRSIDAVAVSLLTGVTASLGTGALVIVRLRSAAEAATFIAIAAAGAAAAWLAQRSSSRGSALDPNVAGLLAAIGAGIVAGSLTDTVDVVNALLAAAITGGGLIAGRTIGAAVRMGQVLHTVRGGGLLTAYDGPMLGAAVFWIAMELLA